MPRPPSCRLLRHRERIPPAMPAPAPRRGGALQQELLVDTTVARRPGEGWLAAGAGYSSNQAVRPISPHSSRPSSSIGPRRRVASPHVRYIAGLTQGSPSDAPPLRGGSLRLRPRYDKASPPRRSAAICDGSDVGQRTVPRGVLSVRSSKDDRGTRCRDPVCQRTHRGPTAWL